ncbi:MAG: glycosyltransferase [Odoribacter splanchnicus]
MKPETSLKMVSDNNNILVSIIIPVFNAERFIAPCIHSLTAQTLQETEIICIDDGSTDSSPQLLDQLASIHSNIRVIHQTNRGQGAARNRGVRTARGKYIGFVDADDIVAPGMYEHLYQIITDNQADIAVCRAYNIDESGNDIRELTMWNSFPDGLYNSDKISETDFFNNECSPVLWDKLISRPIASRFMSTDLRRGQDFITLIDYISAVSRIVFTTRRMYYYRHHPASVMATPESSKTISEDFKTEKIAVEKIKSHWGNKPIAQLYIKRIKEEWTLRLEKYTPLPEIRADIESFLRTL